MSNNFDNLKLQIQNLYPEIEENEVNTTTQNLIQFFTILTKANIKSFD